MVLAGFLGQAQGPRKFIVVYFLYRNATGL